MLQLPLLDYTEFLETRQDDMGKQFVLDVIRQKWLVAQPEEMVRQLLIHYLLQEKNYNKNRISIERGTVINGRSCRSDILIFDNELVPWMLVECKAPTVNIDEETSWQIARYNLLYSVPYLLITNGRVSYCFAMNYEENSFKILPEVPNY